MIWRLVGVSAMILVGSWQSTLEAQEYPWKPNTEFGTLESRIRVPTGFVREDLESGSFGAWLRGLPMLAPDSPVRLFNGQLKTNQKAHVAVFDIDVGSRDLQQCADAVMRLRAEYLLARGCTTEIHYNFTSGDTSRWLNWSRGIRPIIRGNVVEWKTLERPDRSYENFRKYLDNVFAYAGSASLQREIEQVANPTTLDSGDLFIEGGFPGHAVLVVDTALNDRDERVFLLAQSFMPAQEIHLLDNPLHPGRPVVLGEGPPRSKDT